MRDRHRRNTHWRRKRLREEFHIALPVAVALERFAEPEFIDLLRLTKLANSLLFLLGAVVDADQQDDSSSVRRRITGGLLIGAMSCETLRVAHEVVAHSRFQDAGTSLRRVLDHPLTSSVRGKYLARARDKAAFHADKAVMRDGLAGLKVSIAVLEHVSGFNKLNTYYPTADILAYLSILGDDLPSDAEISDFVSTVESRVQRLQPEDDKDPFDNAIRRAVEVTVQISGALCVAISDLTARVHGEIGGVVTEGPPRQRVDASRSDDE